MPFFVGAMWHLHGSSWESRESDTTYEVVLYAEVLHCLAFHCLRGRSLTVLPLPQLDFGRLSHDSPCLFNQSRLVKFSDLQPNKLGHFRLRRPDWTWLLVRRFSGVDSNDLVLFVLLNGCVVSSEIGDNRVCKLRR